MKARVLLLALATVLAVGSTLATPPSPAAAAAASRLVKAGTIEPEFAVATHRVIDVDGDGRDEIVVIGVLGEVRTWRRAVDGSLSGPHGTLDLATPARALLTIADLDGPDQDGADGPRHLLVLGPAGLRAYPAGADGAFAARAIDVAPRARLALRTGRPAFARFARDVNGDELLDVVVPQHSACELWLRLPADDDGRPRFTRSTTVNVEVERDVRTDTGALTDVLESSFRVPDLRFADVNGDGRDDLLVEDGDVRAFHLQGADGSLPEDATVRVDLALFQDTTPEAELRLGRTLAGGDDHRIESRDLNEDGIPDYVLTHRRKVWVFHGTAAGPQFEDPAQVLKVADDISAMLLVRADGDLRPDLVLVRVDVPSVAGLVRGLLAEWDVEVGAVGYRTGPDGRFGRAPTWEGGVTARLPALLGVLRDPDALIRRFEDLGTRAQSTLTGDLDGDGTADALIVAPSDDGPRLRAWRGTAGSNPDDSASEQALAKLLFGDGDRVWDLDRILGWLGSELDRRAASLTGGRAPDASVQLRDPGVWERRPLTIARLDGATDEVLVVYDAPDRGHGTVIDLLRLQ